MSKKNKPSRELVTRVVVVTGFAQAIETVLDAIKDRLEAFDIEFGEGHAKASVAEIRDELKRLVADMKFLKKDMEKNIGEAEARIQRYGKVISKLMNRLCDIDAKSSIQMRIRVWGTVDDLLRTGEGERAAKLIANFFQPRIVFPSF